MAVNGRLLTVEEREELWSSGWEQLPRERAAATCLLFNDRQASLDSLHHFLNAPRKAPVKDKIRCLVAKEIRCEPALVKATLGDCKEVASLILEKNGIRAEGVDQLVAALQGRSNLEVLSLKRNLIGDKGAAALGSMLASWRCRKLHTLCLSFCNVSGQGLSSLCAGLCRMPTVISLTSLDVSNNFCKVDGCRALAPLIMDSRKLKHLNLGNNCIEDEGVKALAEAVGHSDVLETLNLEGNHITNTGVRSLCEALKKNCAVNALELQCNEIDHIGAMYISQAVRANTVLTCLNLSHNQAGDGGAEHLAGMLRVASNLVELRLVGNAIGDKGGKFIELAYEKNTTLTMLDLDMNTMQDEQHKGLANAMRKRGHIGILHVGCHAYGNLRPDNKLLEAAKAQIELEEAEKENESKPQTPRTPRQKSGTQRKPGLDTGNVKLVVKKKEEAPKPTGPIGVLFKKWSGAGEGQKGSKKAKSVDFKEFSEMLKALKLMPGKIGRHKVQEIFRQANRRADDPTPDGDTSEMDWDEFEFAVNKICEFCKVDAETLANMDTDSPATGGKTSPRRNAEPLRGKDKNAAKGAELPPDASLNEIFMKFAAGDGQSKKRAASMDGKEFIAVLEYLKLLPAKVNKTQAMDFYAKGKAKSGGDKSEMDWDGFEFAMKKVADVAGVSYGLLHTLAQSSAEDAAGSPRKLKEVGKRVSNVLKMSPRKTAAPPQSAESRGGSRSPRKTKLQEAGTKVSQVLKIAPGKKPGTSGKGP